MGEPRCVPRGEWTTDARSKRCLNNRSNQEASRRDASQIGSAASSAANPDRSWRLLIPHVLLVPHSLLACF